MTDAKLIADLLRRHAAAGSAVHALEGGHRLPLALTITGVELDGHHEVIRVATDEPHAVLELGREYTLVVPGQGAVTTFSSRLIGRQADRLTLALPGEVVRTGFRRSLRALPAQATGAAAHLVLARAPHEPIRQPVLDVAAHGLSLVVDGSDIVLPGDRLSQVTIEWAGCRVEAQGVVRSVLPQAQGRLRCGVELVDFAGPEDAQRWHHFVFGQIHPRLHLATGSNVRSAWRILKRSEYVSLWVDEAERNHIERDFTGDWKASAPSTGSLLLLENDRGPVGMISGSLLYPRSWLMHHLAVDAEERTKERKKDFFAMADQLYSGITYSLTHMARARYFIAYFERNKNWNRYLYEEFTDRYVRKEHQLYEARSVHRRTTAAPLGDADAVPGGLRIVPGDAALMAELSDRLGQRLPAMELDAFAYGRSEIGLSDFSHDCAHQRGYERRRDVFFALDGSGKALAALVCEAGGEGVNIFGLLNTCWIFPLAGAVETDVARALLGRAVHHYRALDKRSFVLFETPGTLGDAPKQTGFDFVSDGVRWMARTEVLPVWQSYVADLMSARQSADRPN